MSEEAVESKAVVEETETISPIDVEVPAEGGTADASTSKTEDTAEVAGGEEDVTMDENEEDKKRRACRQSESQNFIALAGSEILCSRILLL